MMTRKNLIELYKTFKELGEIKEGTFKFHYFVAKNIEILEKDFNILAKMEQELVNKREEVNKKYALKNDKGEFEYKKAMTPEGKFVDEYRFDHLTTEKTLERNNELDPVLQEFADFYKFLNEELDKDPELKTISEDQIPDEVPGNSLRTIILLLTEEKKS